jgi:NADPH2:quinone reductase
MNLTKNNGVNAIYDCYGQDFFKTNCQILGFLGLLINYGDVTGMVKDFDVSYIWSKSLFYTKPHLSIYKGNKAELALSADFLFKQIKDRVITPQYTAITFDNIPKAHEMLNNRKSTGSIIAKF